ncbi:DUF4380 domain-containing protein [Candidatus Latescibacterota bacterium]
MQSVKFYCKISIILFFTTMCACSEDKTDKRPIEATGGFSGLSNTFNGWNSVILRNSFTELDIVPELGGKIMGYNAFGNQILWHNPSLRGEIETFRQNDIGEEFINSGGAKVWPAPQSKWGGPPDMVIDGSPYDYSLDNKIVTVTGPEDNESGRTGIQYIHSYSLEPSSTIVDLHLSLKNCIESPIQWALWHLTTVPTNRNFTVYVPVNDGNWEVMHGGENNIQWLGVEDGLFRARFDGRVGKVGMKVREGWAAVHDEDNEIVYTLLYPLEKNVEYPHNGHNFEIWSTGEIKNPDGTIAPEMSYMELEILGPLANLAPDESTSMDVKWAACKSSGVKRVTPFAVISEEITFVDGVASGKFGVFQSGAFEQEMFDTNGERRGIEKILEVSPISEVSFKREPYLPDDAVRIRYQVTDSEGTILGILADIKIK